MKFKKISIKNIRSYVSQELEFPESSFLLSGDIGSGKTSILLAIEYALFGLQAGQKGSSLIRNGQDTAEVVLEFELNGETIIVERRLKRDKKSIVNDYSALTVSGRREEYSTTELKSKILELLGYPAELLKKNNTLYKYTVYTPQEQMKSIILEDPEKRLSLLRYVFGIDKYKKIRENLSIVLDKLKEESRELQVEVKLMDQESSILESTLTRLGALEERIEQSKSLLERKIVSRKSHEEESKFYSDKISEKNRLDSELEKTNILLHSKKENLVSLDAEEKEAQEAISSHTQAYNEQDYRDLIKNIDKKREIIDKLNDSAIKLMAHIKNLETERDRSLEEKERIFTMAHCPTCLQDVPDSHKHNIVHANEKKSIDNRKQSNSLERENKEVLQRIDSEKSELFKLEDQKTALEVAKSKEIYFQESRERLERIKSSKDLLKKDIELLEKHISSIKEQSLKLSNFENLHNKKEQDLKSAFQEERQSEINLAESNKELELTQKDILMLRESLQKRKVSQEKLKQVTELTDWLSHQFLALINVIERQVLMKLRLEFSRLFSNWFGVLGGDNFEVQLDENFTPLILQKGVEMEYSFLSGGERTAIALAYRLALNQTINSVYSTIKTKDILILDEPTEGFSEKQVDKIRNVLDQLNVKQLIIVSHENKIESFVDEIIEVRKLEESTEIIKKQNSPPKSLNTISPQNY